MKSVVDVEPREEKSRHPSLRLFALAMVVCAAALLSGCSWRQPGEARVEVDRRHQRALRLNQEMLLSDLDRVLMLDQPSRLTDKRIP